MQRSALLRTTLFLIVIVCFSVQMVFAYESTDWDSLMNRAALCIAQGNQKDALEYFQQAIQSSERSQNQTRVNLSHRLLANYLLVIGRCDLAESHYRRAIDADKDDPESYRGLAQVYIRTKKTTELQIAKAQISSIEAKHSGVDMGSFMGDLQRRIKRVWFPPKSSNSLTAKAIFVIEKDGRLDSMCLYKSSGNATMDDAALKALMRCDPFASLPQGAPNRISVDFDFAYNVFGQTPDSSQDEERARRSLKHIQERFSPSDPTLIHYLCQLGDECSKSRKYSEAESLYKQAESIQSSTRKPENALRIAHSYGMLLLDTARYDEAESLMKQTIKIISSASSPLPPEKTAEIYQLYGKVLYKVNRIQEGADMFLKARELLKK